MRNINDGTSALGSQELFENHPMNSMAILYATREGHSQRIAERVATVLSARGFRSEGIPLQPNPVSLELGRYSTAILVASVHVGKHEREMVNFIQSHRGELDALPTLLISVSLSQAGAEMAGSSPQARARAAADVEYLINKLINDTGWRPTCVKPVAGALMYSKYNPFVKFIMKRIARKAGAGTDTSRDYCYTDWGALEHFIAEFARKYAPLHHKQA